jgi:hypothetical protein
MGKAAWASLGLLNSEALVRDVARIEHGMRPEGADGTSRDMMQN